MTMLCNIQVLQDHIAGIVGGQLSVSKDQRFVGVYSFETKCGTFTCCILDGKPVYFDAEKVKVTGMSNRYYPESEDGTCWVGNHISKQPKKFYVIDAEGGAPIPCTSSKDADGLAQKLNQELVANE